MLNINTPIPAKYAIAIVLAVAIAVGAVLLVIINAPLPPPPISIPVSAPAVTITNNPPPPANTTSTNSENSDWKVFHDPSVLAVSFKYPPTWSLWPNTAQDTTGVTISNVAPDTQFNTEDALGVCKISFVGFNKSSTQTLLQWLQQPTLMSSVSLAPINIAGLKGLRAVGGEIAYTNAVYLSLSDTSILAAELICGSDVQAIGTPMFEKILSTITLN